MYAKVAAHKETTTNIMKNPEIIPSYSGMFNLILNKT